MVFVYVKYMWKKGNFRSFGWYCSFLLGIGEEGKKPQPAGTVASLQKRSFSMDMHMHVMSLKLQVFFSQTTAFSSVRWVILKCAVTAYSLCLLQSCGVRRVRGAVLTGGNRKAIELHYRFCTFHIQIREISDFKHPDIFPGQVKPDSLFWFGCRSCCVLRLMELNYPWCFCHLHWLIFSFWAVQ